MNRSGRSRRRRGVLRRGIRAAGHVADSLREALRLVRRQTSPILPLVALRDVGPGDFEEIGRELMGYFVSLASLRPSDAVLEIGCGPGRVARPLCEYLDAEGRYDGFDVVAESVAWCRRHVSRRYPNFTFHHADVFNLRYNPGGEIPARDYSFPFPSRSFDFVFLASVFTHMYPEDIQHYLHEIARMLRPTGRLFSTFFLLNAEQSALAEMGRNRIDFRFERSTFRLRDESIPESAVAVPERIVRAMHARAGLRIRDPIHYGSWSGRENGLSFQDIVLAVPPAGR